MKSLLSITLTIIILTGFGQSSQSEYLESKRQFELGNYSVAKLGFQSLFDDQLFNAYASFYYALSSYKNGEVQTAYDMWRQVQINFPEWDQKPEVNYWLALSSFQLENYSTAFSILKELPEELQKVVVKETLGKMTSDALEQAYRLNSDNQQLASFLMKSMMEKPYRERDSQLLSELSEKLNAEIVLEEINLPIIKKDRYAIAVVLPFMFESFANPQTVIRNSIIWDLYTGMKKAQEALSKEGIELELFPFDTKKRGDVSQKLISSGKLEKADVIIGPLYNQPNQVISQYSSDHRITMINPLSSNGEIVGDNPYSFLFMPSYRTQGRVASSYAVKNFKTNKPVFIFYETDRDSIVAHAYLKEIEQKGFSVVRFERLTNGSAQQLQKDFIEKYEFRLDNKYSKEEIDSIQLIPGRLVKTRFLRNKTTGDIIKNEKDEEVLEYFEERFLVKEGSIGHMLVASSSNLLANNFISLSEVRNDTIQIIGYKDWLEFSTVSYNQLERLGIAFISPIFLNKNTEFYEELEALFIKSIGREPGEYHLIGYELIYQLGRLLQENGKYFQRGLLRDEFTPGKIMNGFNYKTFHDNQIVPITKLENLRLVVQPEGKQRDKN